MQSLLEKAAAKSKVPFQAADGLFDAIGAGTSNSKVVNLEAIFDVYKTGFATLTMADVKTMLVKGKDCKKRLLDLALMNGTEEVTWKNLTFKMIGDVGVKELTWSRASAIIALWSFHGKLGGFQDAYTEGGAMTLSLTKSDDPDFNNLWRLLLCPGYHLVGYALLRDDNKFDRERGRGDVGRFLAGAFLMDYMLYVFNTHESKAIPVPFDKWVQVQGGIPDKSTLQKAVMTLPVEWLTEGEAKAMRLTTSSQIVKASNGQGNALATKAFEKMSKIIFTS